MIVDIFKFKCSEPTKNYIVLGAISFRKNLWYWDVAIPFVWTAMVKLTSLSSSMERVDVIATNIAVSDPLLK
jgi:hypothetical protein